MGTLSDYVPYYTKDGIEISSVDLSGNPITIIIRQLMKDKL